MAPRRVAHHHRRSAHVWIDVRLWHVLFPQRRRAPCAWLRTLLLVRSARSPTSVTRQLSSNVLHSLPKMEHSHEARLWSAILTSSKSIRRARLTSSLPQTTSSTCRKTYSRSRAAAFAPRSSSRPSPPHSRWMRSFGSSASTRVVSIAAAGTVRPLSPPTFAGPHI